MKKNLIVLIFLFVLFSSVVGAKPQEITLKVEGKVVKSDVPPFIEHDRTYVPVRFVAENLGMRVNYEYGVLFGDPDTLNVSLTGKNGRVIDVNDNGIFADGINFSHYDENAFPYTTVKDRTFVPIRFIAEALHMDIYWDQETRTVELVPNHKPEIYSLELFQYGEYGEEYIPSKSHKIMYDGERYIIKDEGITLEEFTDYILPELMSEGYDVYRYELTMFGHNCFFFEPSLKKVRGMSCS